MADKTKWSDLGGELRVRMTGEQKVPLPLTEKPCCLSLFFLSFVSKRAVSSHSLLPFPVPLVQDIF